MLLCRSPHYIIYVYYFKIRNARDSTKGNTLKHCSPWFRTDLAGAVTDRAIEEYAARRRFQTRQEIQK
jgi:hypothetical protein